MKNFVKQLITFLLSIIDRKAAVEALTSAVDVLVAKTKTDKDDIVWELVKSLKDKGIINLDALKKSIEEDEEKEEVKDEGVKDADQS